MGLIDRRSAIHGRFGARREPAAATPRSDVSGPGEQRSPIGAARGSCLTGTAAAAEKGSSVHPTSGVRLTGISADFVKQI
ncbi:MAG: hypothetical protein AB7L76_19515 [Burkholderiaceae bacterium]